MLIADTARIALAKQLYSSINNLSFVEGTANDFPELEYDVIFSNYVFHWIQDKEAAFKNIYDHLKPSGAFALCTSSGICEIPDTLLKLLPPEKEQHFRGKLFEISLEEVERMAVSCGFVAQFKEETVSKCAFDNFDTFLQFFMASSNGLFDGLHLNKEKLRQMKDTVAPTVRGVEISFCKCISFIFVKN